MMSHRSLYWTVIGVFVVLGALMLATWDYSTPSAEAETKAEELISAYEQAGLPTPYNTDQVAEVLGTDGGAVCADLGDHQFGLLKTRLGVGGEFYYRPTKIDGRVVAGLVLVADVYCPDKLQDAKDFVNSLNLTADNLA